MTTDEEFWQEISIEESKRIEELIKEGHSRHCACRMVWGDGECTCSKSLEADQ